MKIKTIIVLALMLAGLQTEAQKKPKVKKAGAAWNDDWETPAVKNNKAKTAKINNGAATKSPKRKTKN